MPRRTATTLLLVLLASATTACGQGACTKVGGSSFLKIQVPPAIQRLTKTLEVEVCQGDVCKAVSFASTENLTDDTYVVDVDRFGKHWKADSPSTLTVTGSTKKGRAVLQHTEKFEFDGYYPNGKDCDEYPYVTYSTSVGGEDLVG